MTFSDCFPIWNKLNAEEKELLQSRAFIKKFPAGTIISAGRSDCTGLLLVQCGQLRAFILSDKGKEITLYRLFELDLCLFSASCMLNSIQFHITITAEKDTSAWVIPIEIYKSLMERSPVIANYTNEIMGTRFTDVMWLIEQIMWKSFDKRLAAFLLEESRIENTQTLKITNEQIAAHLGSAREVVTRMLKYFSTEDVVKLARGTIEITNTKKLLQMSE